MIQLLIHLTIPQFPIDLVWMQETRLEVLKLGEVAMTRNFSSELMASFFFFQLADRLKFGLVSHTVR